MKTALAAVLVALAVPACGSSLKAPTVQGEPPEYVAPSSPAAAASPSAAPAPEAPSSPAPVPAPAGSTAPLGDAGAR